MRQDCFKYIKQTDTLQIIIDKLNSNFQKALCDIDQGTSGLSGISGIIGTLGNSGLSGLSGISGLNGLIGNSGLSGLSGISGVPGSLNAWSLSGNTGTTATTNFIGTIDNVDFVLRTNNTERWRITSAGILQSNGSQTIRTSTGQLTLTTGGGNGPVVISTNGTGSIQFSPSGNNRWTIDANGILEAAGAQQIRTATGNLDIRAGGVSSIFFRTNGGLRWSINSTGILQSEGEQTIRTSTGNLTLSTNGGNGNIIITPNGSGIVRVDNRLGINTTPAVTETFRVNSTETTSLTRFANVATSTNSRQIVEFFNENSATFGGIFSLRTHGAGYTAETLFGVNSAGTSMLAAQTTSGFLFGNLANGPLVIGTNNVGRLRLLSNSNILEFINSGQFRTTTGDLTIATAAGNGNINLDPHGAGNVILTNYNSRNFADDAAAAAGGVPLGGIYHNAGILRVRIT